MKIGILTHYNVHNHGAILQLFALARVLRDMGHDAKALQYKKNFDFLPDYAKVKYDIGVKSLPYYARYFVANGLGRTLYNLGKRGTLEKFKREEDLVGDYYSRVPDLDAVCIGWGGPLCQDTVS